MRVFVSTGERSGDQNAAYVVRRIRERFPDITFVGMGGEGLRSAGVEVIADPSDVAVVGFQEALRKIGKINRLRSLVLREALKSDIFLAVDFPGFNLPVALKLKEYGRRVIYYIAPQVWAWGKWRVRHLARLDGVMVVLPFEEPFLRSYGVKAYFVGHPVASVRGRGAFRGDRFTVGFLPGSREDEVRRLLPRMVRIARQIRAERKDVRFLFSLPDGRDLPLEGAEGVVGMGREVIASSDVLVMASGTATLEAAVEGKPAVVLYALSEVSWWLGRFLVKTRCISLPNIILGERVYPEYVQHIDPRKVARDVLHLYETREEVGRKLMRIREALNEDRVARAFSLLAYGSRSPYHGPSPPPDIHPRP